MRRIATLVLPLAALLSVSVASAAGADAIGAAPPRPTPIRIQCSNGYSNCQGGCASLTALINSATGGGYSWAVTADDVCRIFPFP